MAKNGADALLALSKRLKATGETELRKELHKSVREAGKPLIPKIREAARNNLPTHGGLNERIARKPYRAQVRTGVKTAGLRITGGKVDPRINNQGRIAHPVFGRPGSTVVQNVPEARGYFDETLRDSAPQIRDTVTEVLVDYAKKLTRPL